jgi:hypothetical protein
VKALSLGLIGLMLALPRAAAAKGPQGSPEGHLASGGSGFDSGSAKALEQKAEQEAAPKRELDVSRMLFDAESIRQVVSFHMPEIQECYEGVLSETGKRIEGKVVVSAVIDPEGRVTSAKALPKKSTMREPKVVDCVLAMRGWAFPKPGDNRDHPIEYPFVLSVRK